MVFSLIDMDLKKLSKQLLFFSFFYNLFGAMTFAFPSLFSALSGLPVPPHTVYTAFGAGVIFMWAFVYLYLSRLDEINRPLLWVGVFGKYNLFVALSFGYFAEDLGLVTLAFGLVDVVMGLVWMSYLLSTPKSHS